MVENLGKQIAILGCGNMGRALLGGILRAGLASKDQVIITGRRQASVDAVVADFGVRGTLDNAQAAASSDIIILAVKPKTVAKLLAGIAPGVKEGTLVVSILAGITSTTIETGLGKALPIIRAMPNVAALVDESATAITPGAHARPEHVEQARRIFESVGMVEVLEDEDLQDAVTGLSGSGPAYIYMVIEALTDGGVKMGLSRQMSIRLATQAVKGAATLVQETGEHPAVLRDQVTTPGGTAISAIYELESHGLRPMLISAVVTATERSKELSRLGNGK